MKKITLDAFMVDPRRARLPTGALVTGFLGLVPGKMAFAQAAASCSANLVYTAEPMVPPAAVPSLSIFGLALLLLGVLALAWRQLAITGRVASLMMACVLALSAMTPTDLMSQVLTALSLDSSSGGTLSITGTNANTVKNNTNVLLKITELTPGAGTSLLSPPTDCAVGTQLSPNQSCTVQLAGSCADPVVTAVNDTASWPAGAVGATSDITPNDSYPPGSLFTLQPGGTCTNSSVSSTGTATYDVPGSGNCTVNYQVCAPTPNTAVCSTAVLTVIPVVPVVPVVTPVDDEALQLANTVGATSDITPNDTYPPGSLFTLEPGGTCTNSSVSSTGMATYDVPGSGNCTVNYQVCAPSPNAAVCSTAVLTVNTKCQYDFDLSWYYFGTDGATHVVGLPTDALVLNTIELTIDNGTPFASGFTYGPASFTLFDGVTSSSTAAGLSWVPGSAGSPPALTDENTPVHVRYEGVCGGGGGNN
ncbi:midcut-by-XrtH protein [Diaphorobacter sp. HDW4B]|uniref:midcut-by-XrtH protein n=1 Tax=Diaphorobacter sp. HDW4B TaxID=2714925 RepID=UPI001407371F|nr:midcut-by-XrtH protein [Diaphorobacter sp. HDW4B]QIL69365.1 midcut-by-XrtH protein [Diaphorobacter sp. HDW4B]